MADDPGRESAASRPLWLLVAGAVLGIGLAVASLLETNAVGELPPGTAARVNSVAIYANQHERAVEALASDRRTVLSEADRRHVLDRLIDEELLVQYGLSLGLAERDRRVRGDLVSAVLAATVASVDGDEPDEDEVQAFFAQNAEFFRAPGRLRVRGLRIRAEPERSLADATARAEAAVARLRAGEAFDSVAAELGDPQVAAIPDAMLPPVKLREYAGPTALRTVSELSVGAVSEPLIGDGDVRVFLLAEQEPARTPELAAVRSEVLAEMKRRAGDEAVRALLERLRDGAELEISAGSP